jgi:hypothetical protein
MASIGFRNWRKSNASGEPRCVGIEVVRLFLGASLEDIDAADFDRAPARKLSTWLFSLGAVDALAAHLSLEARPTTALAVDVFADFYALDPGNAATVVGRLRQLDESAHWRHAREAGRNAMRGWLRGTEQNSQLALTRLLHEAQSMSATRLAARLTGSESNAAREIAPRAPRAREVHPGRRSAASVLTTR